MKKEIKRFVAAGAAVGLISSLVLTGCGKKDNTTGTNTALDPNGESYVAEFMNCTDSNGKNACVNKLYKHADKLYAAGYNEDEQYDTFVSCINPTDMQVEGTFDYGYAIEQAIDTSMLKGDPANYTFGATLNGIIFEEDGVKILADWYAYDYSNVDPDGFGYSEDDLEDESEDVEYDDLDTVTKQYMVEYDYNYNIKNVEEITFDFLSDDEYIQEIVDDEKGHLCILGNHTVYFTDRDFNMLQSIHVTDNWVESCFIDGNGDLNITYYNDNWDSAICKVSADSSDISEGMDVKGLNVREYFVSIEDKNVLYYYDSEKLCSKDLTTNEDAELLRWLNIDVNGNDITRVCEMGSGVFYVAIMDYNTYTSQIAKVYKKSNAEITEKTVIRLAALTNYDYSLESAIVAFNQSQDQYRIVADYYYNWENDGDNYEDAIANLNNAITGSNAPDIICLEGLDVTSLANKGLLEDLKGYIANSSSINLDDYNKKVVDAYTYDGKLVSLPRSFNLMTVIVNANDFPADKEGWTLEEMLEYLNAHPGSELEAYILKEDFMNTYVGYNLNEYIDWNKGTCDFNKASFKKALEYAATLPDEYDWSNMDDSLNIPDAISQGRILSQRMYISEIMDIQMVNAYFKIGAKYIGFPNAEGKNMQVMSTSTGYAIASNSTNKDVAWEFIESYLNRERSDWDYSFPSKNSELQALYDKELEHAGEPNGSAMTDDTGFEYEFHYSTQEEIDQVNELIDNAVALTVDTEIMNIINEEAGAYFSGQKSVDDVIGLIQSRVQIYVSERM